jgi:competence protein ComEC
MPLVLAAVIAWVAGTVAGLAGIATSGLLFALTLIAIGAAWRASSASLPPLTLILVAGAALGSDLASADATCLAAAARAPSWEVRLRASAAPGSFVRGELAAPRCRVPVVLAVRSGDASAGASVRITRAEVSGSDRELLLREARLELLRGPGPLARWRARVGAALDRRFGPDAPMVRALLIADTRGLAPELRERYADAGLVHLLSISGLHVAIVGGALMLLFQAARLPARAASLAAVLVVTLYVLAIGAPPPAVRSATLFAASALVRAIQRPVSPWGSFALGAAVPLIAPRTVLDLGWQLSVAGYAAIIASSRLGRRLPEEWRGWRAHLAKELAAGALTTAATAPLVAWHFGRLSLIAPISNLAAGPIVALLQPTLFLAMLLPDAVGAGFVADAARPMLRAMDATAAGAAALPGASVPVAPTLFAAALAGIGVVALLVAAWSRAWARPLCVALACVAIVAWMPEGATVGGGRAELHLLDVGQGDAIALRTPRGRWILVDAGRAWRSGDAGRSTVIPYLRRAGGELAMVILTHPHADHIGGIASVLTALRPREMRDAAFVERSALYRQVLATAEAVGTRWRRVTPGEAIEVDGLALEFLAPDSAWTASLDDPNEASTVVRVRHGGVRFLLTGDAERGEERWLLDHAAPLLAADVLKLAHHGSATSSTEAFVDAVAPRIAVVSVGAANGYGHPSPEVMRRLTERGTLVLRTDQLGTVVLRSDGSRIEAEAAGHRWPVARALPESW